LTPRLPVNGPPASTAGSLEPPGVKANALTVLDNLRERYPDISDELKTVIESGFETESPAFKSRASKILKKLKSN
jgi:hypothetical protein